MLVARSIFFSALLGKQMSCTKPIPTPRRTYSTIDSQVPTSKAWVMVFTGRLYGDNRLRRVSFPRATRHISLGKPTQHTSHVSQDRVGSHRDPGLDTRRRGPSAWA